MPDSTPTVRPAFRTALLSALLFAATVLLFSRAFPYPFLSYDDPGYLNLYIQAGPTWEGIKWAFTAPTDYWHPLTCIVHMIDWSLFGADPSGHRLMSACWHAANVVLLFAVLRRFTGTYWLSLLGAVLFGWHPLRVESVVWIAERKDLLSGFFFLLMLLAYAGYAECRARGRVAAGRYALTLGLFAAGLMSKPMLVSAPLVLLVLDYWPLKRATQLTPATGWKLLREKIPFLALSLAVAVVTLKMQQSIGAFTIHVPLGGRLGNALVSIVRYLGKLVWPVDLCVCYPHPGYWPAWIVAGAALLIALLSWACLRQRNRRPWLLAGWLWMLVMLLPVIGIVQVGFQAMADRYTYLPLIGILFWLVGAAAEMPLRRGARGAAIAGVAALVGVGTARTWSQEANWRDTLTLFDHALQVTGPNPFGEGMYAYEAFNHKDVDNAERHARRSLELDPNNNAALYSLAGVLDLHGQPEESAKLLQKAIALRPSDTQAAYRLGLLLLRLNRPDEARAVLQAAVRIRPAVAEENLLLGLSFRQHGRFAEAALCYRIAGWFDPDSATIQCEYAATLLELGRLDEARAEFRDAAGKQPAAFRLHAGTGLNLLDHDLPVEAALHLRAALAVQPDFIPALIALGRAESRQGDFPAAAEAFEKALALTPRDPALLRASAETLARLGRFGDAMGRFQNAIELDPNDSAAHAGLGYMLFVSGRKNEALAEWRTALRLDPDIPELRTRVERLESSLGR